MKPGQVKALSALIYTRPYRKSDWEALSVDGWKGGQSRMIPDQETALCNGLDGRFCRSTVKIRAHVSAEFNLRYSHSGCIKPLARLGFQYRKPKPLPKVASAEKQASFIALYERLMIELGADEAVYFADAVHLEYQTKPAFGWVEERLKPRSQDHRWAGEGEYPWRARLGR